MAIEYPETNEILYREYANAFWKEITDALWSNKGAFEFLPIVFTNRKIYSEKGDIVWGVTQIHTNTAINVTTIYPVVYISDDRTKEEIESTIRHETIHYLLGIQYKCHDDSSSLFWLICDCFSANAYLHMSSKSQNIYDIAKPFINSIFEMYKLTKSERVAINFSLMLMVIDNAEAEQVPDLTKLEKCLKTCEDAAHI